MADGGASPRVRAFAATDLADLAEQCAECFRRARCAGCDLKVIRLVAKAALRVGAEISWLYPDSVPYADDAGYLSALDSLRVTAGTLMAAVRSLIRDLKDERREASRTMREALTARPRDWGQYYEALRVYRECNRAISECQDTLQAVAGSVRDLVGARADFAVAYEAPESFVAAGAHLPHEGRWITGGETVPQHAR